MLCYIIPVITFFQVQLFRWVIRRLGDVISILELSFERIQKSYEIKRVHNLSIDARVDELKDNLVVWTP